MDKVSDPVTRLHNICAALEEQLNDSPFTREEWDRIDRRIVRLEGAIRRAITHLRTTVEPYESHRIDDVPHQFRDLRTVLDALREGLKHDTDSATPEQK